MAAWLRAGVDMIARSSQLCRKGTTGHCPARIHMILQARPKLGHDLRILARYIFQLVRVAPHIIELLEGCAYAPTTDVHPFVVPNRAVLTPCSDDRFALRGCVAF